MLDFETIIDKIKPEAFLRIILDTTEANKIKIIFTTLEPVRLIKLKGLRMNRR